MKYIEEKYLNLISAMLDKIRQEMDRLYWNKNQKEMNSPFDNTGERYSNNTFSVSAYSWQDDNYNPNFICDELEVYWYKHSHRGLCVKCSKEVTVDYLADILNKCLKSLTEDFYEWNI